MHTDTRFGLRQVLAPAAAVALIAGGIALRPGEAMTDANLLDRAGCATDAVAAFFCPPEEKDQTIVGTYAEPLTSFERHNQAQAGEGRTVFFSPQTVVRGQDGKSSQRVYLTQVDQDGTYEITIKDGEISAKVDGKAVPQDRIRRTDGKVEILGADGKVKATFQVGGEAGFYGVIGAPWTVELDDMQSDSFPMAYSYALTSEPPKVMLGVTMSDASAEVLEYFGIESSKGIMLDRVIEGLPAAKAGLKSQDIIIGINGAKEATPEALRKLLREKSPGDTLEVKVLSKGEVRSLEIKLAEYDAGQLGVQTSVVTEMPKLQGQLSVPQLRELYGNWDSEKSQEAVEKAMKTLESIDTEAISGEARKAIEEAMKKLESEDFTRAFSGIGEMKLEFQPDMRLFSDEEGNTFTFPRGAVRGFEWRAAEEEVAGLEERLTRLEEKLERLEKAIEKLTADR